MLRKSFYVVCVFISMFASSYGQTGTARTWSEIMALLPDNVVGAITPQDLRDLWQTSIDSIGARAYATTVNLHISNTTNPHSVTAAQVGLGNVTNESKAVMFTNPIFTGTTGATFAGATYALRASENHIDLVSTNTDGTPFWVNYRGYDGGTTRFRDFLIGDGKQSAIIHAVGSTKSVTVYGDINLNNNDLTNVSTINGVAVNSIINRSGSWDYTVLSPQSSEEILLKRTVRAVTIDSVTAVLVTSGSSNSVPFNIVHGGSNLFSSNQTVTAYSPIVINVSSNNTFSNFSGGDATIAANEFMHIKFGTIVGTPAQLFLSIYYTED